MIFVFVGFEKAKVQAVIALETFRKKPAEVCRVDLLDQKVSELCPGHIREFECVQHTEIQLSRMHRVGTN
jgi:hypothetical protein